MELLFIVLLITLVLFLLIAFLQLVIINNNAIITARQIPFYLQVRSAINAMFVIFDNMLFRFL